MNPLRVLRWLLLLPGLLPGAGWAQIVIDTSRVYYLGEIEIVAQGTEPLNPGTIQHIVPAELERTDAFSAVQLMELVPAAFVQTNSRGESLVYLRNAGERQVALFLDGALLNIPWDNRIDLQLLPSGVVGSMTVVRGIPSVLYGPNTAGGVINLTSRNPGSLPMAAEGSLQAGLPETYHGHLLLLRRSGPWRWTGALEGVRSVGMPLPEDYERYLPFNQTDPEIRTNTDFRRLNLFSRIEHRGSRAQTGITFLHVQGAKGVAPEGHKNPAEARVRFWRYPDWRYTTLIANQQGSWKTWNWKASLWGTYAHQEIVQYASVAYRTPLEREDGDDYTLGARLVLAHPLAGGRLHGVLYGLTSRHDQHEATFLETGWRFEPLLTYQQHLLSAGLKYDRKGRHVDWTVGASLDGSLTPRTGDKPAQDPFRAPALQAGLRYRLSEALVLRLGTGMQSRFPTLRELYGEALRRFFPNPDLRPETIYAAEFALLRATSRYVVEGILFGRRTSNTIDQESIQIEGERRRRRINLRGSRMIGVELNGLGFLTDTWMIEGFWMWNHLRAYNEATGKYDRYIPEKPASMGRLRVSHQPEQGLNGQIELAYQGRAYSLTEENTFAALPRALTINLRAAYRLPVARQFLEVYVRVNNLTDTVVLPQLGLPGPGRSVLIGVKLLS